MASTQTSLDVIPPRHIDEPCGICLAIIVAVIWFFIILVEVVELLQLY